MRVRREYQAKGTLMRRPSTRSTTRSLSVTVTARAVGSISRSKVLGEIVGQQVAASTLEDVANDLRRIEPPVFPDIETVALKDGTTVIALRVPGGGGPHTYDGRPYQRHGPTTRVMPRGVYEQRVVEKLHATNRCENQAVPSGVTTADLDEEEIQHQHRHTALRHYAGETGPTASIQALEPDHRQRVLPGRMPEEIPCQRGPQDTENDLGFPPG